VATDGERVEELAAVAVGDERERIERILATARETLGMQIAYFTEIDAGEQVIRRVAGDPGGMGLVGGTRVALDDTYCRRMLDEEIPAAVPDADAEPVLRALREVEPSRPLAYLGVPLQLSSGRVYGTLCAASESARDELRDRDIAFMRVLARLLADVLERPPAGAPAWLNGDSRPALRHDGRVAHLAFWVVATPRAVQAARRAIDCLSDWIPEAPLADLHIVISELVTNSVRHAGLEPSSAVGIDVVVEPGVVRGSVSDPGVGFDVAAVPEPEAGQIGGWGLRIVRQVSRTWGVVRPPSGGAAVSFELELPT
jgi:anti-sigma regulatory factor (Ser/Thr protein kinase)